MAIENWECGGTFWWPARQLEWLLSFLLGFRRSLMASFTVHVAHEISRPYVATRACERIAVNSSILGAIKESCWHFTPCLSPNGLMGPSAYTHYLSSQSLLLVPGFWVCWFCAIVSLIQTSLCWPRESFCLLGMSAGGCPGFKTTSYTQPIVSQLVAACPEICLSAWRSKHSHFRTLWLGVWNLATLLFPSLSSGNSSLSQALGLQVRLDMWKQPAPDCQPRLLLPSLKVISVFIEHLFIVFVVQLLFVG